VANEVPGLPRPDAADTIAEELIALAAAGR
jgi:hypothetical protein